MRDPEPEGPTIEERAAQQDRNGWGPIPLPTRKKAQPPAGFTGSHPMPSYADWYTYYGDEPAKWGNLGARFPENVVGIDVDAYDGKNGEQVWLALGGKADLPDTVVVSARFSPGYDGVSGIRLYRLPDGFDQATMWGAHDGVEILRHGHRYALSPRSDHPTKGMYQALDVRTKEFLDVLPPVDSLPQLTQEQADRLTVAGAPWAGEVSDIERPKDDNPMCAYTAKQLNKAIGSFKHKDSRYDSMSKAVWSLVHGEDEGHHLGEALEILKLAYVAAAAKDRREAGHEPPDSEFDRNLKDALRKVAENPTDEMFKACCSTGMDNITIDLPGEMEEVDEEPDDEDEAKPETAYEKEVRRQYVELRIREDAKGLLNDHVLGEAKPLVHLSLREFLSQPDEDDPYRVQDLWPKEGRAMLVAAAKSGKSTLVASNLIPSLVDGNPFLGRYDVVPVTRRVVYINLELSPRILRTWMRRIGITNIDAVEVVNLRGQASALTISTSKGRTRVANMLLDMDAEAVILDPLAPLLAALGLEENDNAGIARFYNYWSETMKEAGVTDDMIVHHTGHAGERSRGASRLLDEPDAVWTLTRAADSDTAESEDGGIWEAPAPRYLQAIGRDVMLSPEELEYDNETGLLRLTGIPKGRSLRKNRIAGRKEASLHELRDLFADGRARTLGEIKTALSGSANVKAQLVSELVDDGFLYPTGASKNGKELYLWSAKGGA